SLAMGSEDSSVKSKIDELLLKGKTVASALLDTVALSLAIRFGNPGELDGIGCLISTSAISGAGASNVGVAGAAAIAVVNGVTEATIAPRTSLPSGDDIKVTGDSAVRARAAQKVYTTATASSDVFGNAVKETSDTSGTSVGVGASAAISVIDVTAKATLGAYRKLAAATLEISADAHSDIDSVCIAGSDPIARRQEVEQLPTAINEDVAAANNTTTKDIAVDAAVALALITNDVLAAIFENAVIRTTGLDTIKTGVMLTPDTEELVNFLLRAHQRGQTRSSASGFAVAGGKAAVGAAIAVNIAMSDVRASFAGTGTVAGTAKIMAVTSNEDEAHALATVVGASLDRYLDKLRQAMQMASVGNNEPTNSFNNKVTGKLNTILGKSGMLQRVPLSSSLFQKMGINTPAAPSSSTANNAATTNGGSGATGQPTDQSATQSQSVNVAAALGANITNHKATAEVTGALTAKDVEVSAEDRSNFRTLGSGATVTGPSETNANNIALGVAVSINKNRAEAKVSGTLTASGNGTNNGNIRVRSVTTGNMDGAYRGLLGAQAIACSVAGTGGKIGLAGAVAVIVANSKSIAEIASTATLTGGAITVSATEQSKLAVRAGSVSVTGASVGVGASFAVIYAENVTRATIAGGAHITGGSLKLEARKLCVDSTDYQFPLGISTLFTVDATEDRMGLLNIQTEGGSVGGYAIDITLGMDDVLKILDMMNFLASANYYAEAIAGSVVGSPTSNGAFAGSVAMLISNN
ncbi:MAG: hypothetical protein GX592_02030, partial [Clostridiales bacterium]|nr:hypothetical protein [Clostridiales bacterium]